MERVNFAAFISQLVDTEQHYGPQAKPLTIVGGTCPDTDLLTFLSAWRLLKDDMRYCLWEEVSDMVLTHTPVPSNPALLERGRVFGTGGDLSLRRDGERFLWWFIGPAGVAVPTAIGEPQDFWAHHQDLVLHRHEETALLWGVWARQDDTGREIWQEDRVARARLHYPGLPDRPDRVQVRFWSFTTAGQVAFVWLRGLEAYNG